MLAQDLGYKVKSDVNWLFKELNTLRELLGRGCFDSDKR